VLSTLGATFDGVALLWNRVADLDAHEEAVLMSRARWTGLALPCRLTYRQITSP